MKVLGIAILALASMLATMESSWASRSRSGSKSGSEVKATLTDAIGGKAGKAEYQVHVRNGTPIANLEIEVSHLTLAAGTTINFLVNGTLVGSNVVKVESEHGKTSAEASLHLSTPKNTVPAIAAGSTVSVQLADGTVLASGSF